MKKRQIALPALWMAAVLFLAAFFAPLAAAETPKEALERLREEKQQIERQIEQAQKNEEDAAALKTLYTQKAAAVEAQMAALNLQISDQSGQVEALQQSVAAAVLDVQASEEAFRAHLKGMYEMSGRSELAVLLGLDSMAEMLSYGEYTRRIAAGDDAVITAYREKKDALDGEAAKAQQALDALNASKAELAGAQAEYAEALRQADGRLTAAQAEAEAAEKARTMNEQELAEAEKAFRAWVAQNDNPAAEYTGGQFQWPLPGYTRRSSEFGSRMLNGKPDFHYGIDIPAPAGTKIYAAADGVVSFTAHWSYGTCVKVSHGGGLVTIYAHMSARAEGLQAGDTVARGQLLGYVGCTGNAFGNHLHFEVDVNGKATDPLPYLGAG